MRDEVSNSGKPSLSDMTFKIAYFLPAIALLWLPWVLSAKQTKAYRRSARNASATLVALFTAWQNWADLARSMVGGYLLLNCSIDSTGEGSSQSQVFYVKAAIIGIGVLLQMVRFNSGLTIYAPLFYLTGLTFVLPADVSGGLSALMGMKKLNGWELLSSSVGIFSALFGWVFACGLKDPRRQLPAMGIMLLISGYFLGRFDSPLLLNVALIFAPLMLGVALSKRLLLVLREKKAVAASAGNETKNPSGKSGQPQSA